MGCSNVKASHPIVTPPYEQGKYPFSTSTRASSVGGEGGPFTAESAALRAAQIGNTALIPTRELSHVDFYCSNKLQPTQGQYALLNAWWGAMDKAIHAPYVLETDQIFYDQGLLDASSVVANADRHTTQVAKCIEQKLQQAREDNVDRGHPLFRQAYEITEKACRLLANRKMVSTLASSSAEVRRFFDTNFIFSAAAAFNRGCLKIASDSVSNKWETLFDELIVQYACKGILENQLPSIKATLSRLKQQALLEREVTDLLEAAVYMAEVGLENMNHPQRAAILDPLTPFYRPGTYEENGQIARDTIRKCAALIKVETPEEQVDKTIAKLREVQLIFGYTEER